MILLVFIVLVILLRARANNLKSYFSSLAVLFFMLLILSYSVSDNARVEYSSQQAPLTATHLDANNYYYIEETSNGYYNFLSPNEFDKHKVDASNSHIKFDNDVAVPYVTYYEWRYSYSDGYKFICDFGLFFTRDHVTKQYCFVVPMGTSMSTALIESFNRETN